jgi:hypothetical protein
MQDKKQAVSTLFVAEDQSSFGVNGERYFDTGGKA